MSNAVTNTENVEREYRAATLAHLRACWNLNHVRYTAHELPYLDHSKDIARCEADLLSARLRAEDALRRYVELFGLAP